MEPQAGTRFGPYELLEAIGQGSVGSVYRARDEEGQLLAIKVMRDAGADSDSRERFKREAEIARGLKHRHIVRVMDAGEVDDVPYIAMELLEGQSLRSLARTGVVHPPVALDIVGQAALGLQHAHELGVVHRDVKPANIWLTNDGVVKILDFGVAKATDSTVTLAGSLVGTVSYMSPEQLANTGRLDGRTDVYSLGAVLFELIAGKRPFEAETPMAVMAQILSGAPIDTPPVFDSMPGLRDVVRKALAHQVSQRYESAQELAWDAWQTGLARLADSPNIVEFADAMYDEASNRETVLTAGSRPEAEKERKGAKPQPQPQPQPRARTLSPLKWAAAAIVIVATLGVPAWVWWPAAPAAAVVEPVNEGPRELALETTPSEADIFIDGQPASSKTPAKVQARAGQTIRVEKAGFAPVELIMTPANLAQATHALTLEPLAKVPWRVRAPFQFEVLQGDTVISAASDSHEVAVTPGLPVQLRARRLLLNQTVILTDATIREAMTLPAPGRLSLRTVYETCRIFLNDRDFGFPPLSRVALVAGTYAIELRCPDGRSRRSQVSITSNESHLEVVR
jgi:predicted Ser/Thr protein kinase